MLPFLAEGGKLTPFRALAQLYSRLEVRTRLTGPVAVDFASLGAPGGQPSALLAWLQPTVVLSGPAGVKTIAPHGEAPANPHGALLLAGGALLLLGSAVGGAYLLGRRHG